MSNKRSWSEDDRWNIVAAFDSGRSQKDIAAEYRTKTQTISLVLREAGRDTNRRQFMFTPEQELDITSRYEAGELSGHIAERYGCAVATVRQVVRRNGGDINARGNRYREFTPDEIDLMRRWSSEGISQDAIAGNLGTHRIVVSRVMRQHGIASLYKRAGASHNRWQGGRIDTGEYVWIWVPPDHPFASMRNRQGYIPEHRLVMANKMGRALSSTETVHHKDGNGYNNAESNLQLRIGRHGKGSAYCCADCGSRNIVPVKLDG